MDWRLNERNAEQNYKIIIDKGAVRTGGTQYLLCLPRPGSVAPATPQVFIPRASHISESPP